MAWALQFDGVNDYVSFSSSLARTEVLWELEVKFKYLGVSGGFLPLISDGSFSTYIRMQPNLNLAQNYVRFRVGATNITVALSVSFFDANYHTIKFICGVGGTDIYVDGGFESTIAHTSAIGAMNRIGSVGSQYGYAEIEYAKYYDQSSGNVLIHNWDATASSHAAGTPVLTDTIGGNSATGVNMPTDGSAWLNLGGSGISITGATANSSYSAIDASVDLTGEIQVTGTAPNSSYSAIDSSLNLTPTISVDGETTNSIYSAYSGILEFSGLISIEGDTPNSTYSANDASVILQGQITFSGNTTNYTYNALNGTIILQGPVTINPKNIFRVKRVSNIIRVKRQINTIIVR